MSQNIIYSFIPIFVYVIFSVITFILVNLRHKFNRTYLIFLLHVGLLLCILISSLMFQNAFVMIFHDISIGIYPFIILSGIFTVIVLGKNQGSFYIISAILQDFSVIIIGYYIIYVLNLGSILSLALITIPYIIVHIDEISVNELKKMGIVLVFANVICSLIYFRLPGLIIILHLVGGSYFMKQGYLYKEFINQENGKNQ